ncbi:hypothetical protein B0H11DRAFT_2204368 [Mycena galericulata]|nr:hypothetical protein B0H11DRAFT_2204368 [Mycena galericulata]
MRLQDGARAIVLELEAFGSSLSLLQLGQASLLFKSAPPKISVDVSDSKFWLTKTKARESLTRLQWYWAPPGTTSVTRHNVHGGGRWGATGKGGAGDEPRGNGEGGATLRYCKVGRTQIFNDWTDGWLEIEPWNILYTPAEPPVGIQSELVPAWIYSEFTWPPAFTGGYVFAHWRCRMPQWKGNLCEIRMRHMDAGSRSTVGSNMWESDPSPRRSAFARRLPAPDITLMICHGRSVPVTSDYNKLENALLRYNGCTVLTEAPDISGADQSYTSLPSLFFFGYVAACSWI